MNDCIFCKILKKELPAKVIYEDEISFVFMTTDPCTNGHLLMIPKQHVVTFDDVQEEFITHSLKVIRDIIYPLVKDKLHAEGLTIAQNNYLGQEVKHFHIHLVPRYKGDNLIFNYNEDLLESLDDVFKKIKSSNN